MHGCTRSCHSSRRACRHRLVLSDNAQSVFHSQRRTNASQRPELPATVITHRLPLEAAPEAFRIARDRKAGAIKVVLEP